MFCYYIKVGKFSNINISKNVENNVVINDGET